MAPDVATSSATESADEIPTTTALPTTHPSTTSNGKRQMVRWDQILPRRSLRVLLVEHDDSTRQIVTALLRKCGYHVAAVVDGMKAWDVLRQRGYAFDLVLSEVAMPSLSGIGLLSRIVAADECKNIPVIMMSSQDSIGVVLKCMLKGAVDFLVKPVRKNELRNLWQHVWRRHCINTQANASENNAASNHLSVNAGEESDTGENSDAGTDGQSSGSKREVEIQSAEKLPEIVTPERASSSRETEVPPAGPCGGVNTTEDGEEAGDKSGEIAGAICGPSLLLAGDMSSHHPSGSGKNLLVFSEQTTDRRCNSSPTTMDDFGENALCKDSTCSNVRGKDESRSSLLLEVSLVKQQLNDFTNQELRDKDIFNHSNSSAFLRYGDKRIQMSVQRPLSSSIRIGQTESVNNERNSSLRPNDISPSHQRSAIESTMYVQVSLDSNKEGAGVLCSSSAREDAGTSHASLGQDTSFSHAQIGFIPVPIPVGPLPYQSFCNLYGMMLQPIYDPRTFLQHNPAAIENRAIQRASDQSNYHGNVSNQPQLDEHHQPEENQQLHHSTQSYRESTESRDVTYIPVERGNQSQDILKGSGCIGIGSGETAAATTNTIVALESGNESGVQYYYAKGLDSDRSRREAALIKFRMKRKDRCFEKKVRYHSRKKLAEQRPRVKGQFVSPKLKSAATTDAED